MTTTTEPNATAVPVVLPVDLRDYFAAKALGGPAVFNDEGFKRTPKEVAEVAYAMADAMLAARGQP